jgi:hypothetical protein
MKHLLIALIALTMTLGVGCKKEEVKTEQPLKIKKVAIAVPVVEHNVGCPAYKKPEDPGYGPCLGCPKSTGH